MPQHPPTPPSVPRLVNIINFVRACEPRLEMDLLTPLLEQLRLLREHSLPGTFLLQHDAIIDPMYTQPLRGAESQGHEVGAWLEVVQSMAERAGLKWRGRFPWDWHSDVGFTIGYTPREREALIDVLMTDFKKVFGVFPRSVGSWYIDAHSLGYLHDRYGVRASCNCKDQIGTDGYTMWGGYWNQAYYPSRTNSFLPAQNAAAQIPIPIFRMLGSDPIYQYDVGLGEAMQGVVSLEPVYKDGGGNPAWVRWFFDVMLREPSLGFAYAQVGQENSFGWKAMGAGLNDQIAFLAREFRAGTVRVETLEKSAEWFKQTYPVTPPTAVTALSDPRAQGRKTVWFNSRFYRANLLWQGTEFRIRDLQKFDERYAERYMDAVTTTPYCEYDALPVMDGFRWSTADEFAGVRLVEVMGDGSRREIGLVGHPRAESFDNGTLKVSSATTIGARVEVQFTERDITIELSGEVSWALAWRWSEAQTTALTAVTADRLSYRHNHFEYHIGLSGGIAQNPAGHGFDLIASGRRVVVHFDT